MSLGSLLLQPQRVQRVNVDPHVMLMEDVTRLVAVLGEDLVEEGVLSQSFIDALLGLGPRFQTELAPKLGAAQTSLRVWMRPGLDYVASIETEVAAVGSDLDAGLALTRHLIGDLKSMLANLTLGNIRTQIQFFVDVLENDLGVDQQFIDRHIALLLDDVVNRWQALPAEGDPHRRRARRLAIGIVQRLKARLSEFVEFPRLDVDALARMVIGFLEDSGANALIDQVECAIDAVEEALGAADQLDDAVPFTTVAGGASVGAAFAQIDGGSRYSWYASWLLRDKQLPLIGASDLDDPNQFLRKIKDRQGAVAGFLNDELDPAVRATLNSYDPAAKPADELVRSVLMTVNRLIQSGPIYSAERFPGVSLTGDLDELRDHFVEKQCLFLYNRRFLENQFSEISDVSSPFWGDIGVTILDFFGLAPNQVYVTGDGQFVMCDDKPMLTGVDLKWYDAPIFSASVPGQMWYNFEHIPADVCEGFAQHTAWPAEAGKAAWHLIDLQPGHEIGTGTLSWLGITDTLAQLIFCKPISGYENLGKWGKWLNSGVLGPKALAVFGGSFQGLHTAASPGNGFLFWVTVVLGDAIRVFGHNSIIDLLRNFVLSWITLFNFRGPRDAPSTLPSQPAQNHLDQGGVTALVNALFGMWLLHYYELDDYSIELIPEGTQEQHLRTFLGLWFGGSIGMGILSGLTGSLVAQITAWAEDWELLGKTMALCAAGLFAKFWLLKYAFVEGNTRDGTYNPAGRDFVGYPDKNIAPSPYRLPYEEGTSLYVGQANQGLFSHNFIAGEPNNFQVYAYDFGHDHQQMIVAARSGTIQSITEGNANDGGTQNDITIMHDGPPDATHDAPFGGTPVRTYARYIHGAFNGVSAAFGGTRPAIGTAVAQGQPIMQADDTGTSFHSHLHMHVHMDDGSGNMDDNFSIPFVFDDVDGDGRLINLTWYRAGG